jgi:hypothetical protein
MTDDLAASQLLLQGTRRACDEPYRLKEAQDVMHVQCIQCTTQQHFKHLSCNTPA